MARSKEAAPMSFYTFAVYFWSAVAAVAFVLPLLAKFVWDVFHAIERHHHDELGSVPSGPRPSRP
jgi:hypothetical protein